MQHQDTFVPALLPAARVLFIQSEDKAAGLLAGLGRASSPLKRIAEVAELLGHFVTVVPEYQGDEDDGPEVVLLDAGAHDLGEQLSALRNAKAFGGVPFIAVIGSRTRDEELQALQGQGINEFLSADASRGEIQARLESAIALFRSREQTNYLREQLNRHIRVDDLTGVMSRRFFFQQAHRECSRSRRYGHKLACLMLEVNHFKMLCSTFSEMAGEQVLRSVATIIGQWTRDSDLVARFSEAKFVVLLPETDITGATTVREKIQVALLEHVWKYDKSPMPVTVSIGEAELEPISPFRRADAEYISEGDETGEIALSTREALAGLLEDADAALYIARKGARVPEVFVPYTPTPEEGVRATVLPDPKVFE